MSNGKEPASERRLWRLLIIAMSLLLLPVLLKFIAYELGDERTLKRLERVIEFIERVRESECEPCEHETSDDVFHGSGIGRRATAVLGKRRS